MKAVEYLRDEANYVANLIFYLSAMQVGLQMALEHFKNEHISNAIIALDKAINALADALSEMESAAKEIEEYLKSVKEVVESDGR